MTREAALDDARPKLGVLRGFLIDLALAVGAGALSWHPVFDWLSLHQDVVYWLGGALHIVTIPTLFLQTMGGHAKSADLLLQNRTSAHERAWVWSSVAMIGTSFVVPFGASLFLHAHTNVAFSMAVLFAPFAAFVGPMLAFLALPRLAQRGVEIPNLFGHRAGRLAVAATVTAYLALEEATMFLALASEKQASGTMVFLGLFLSYLPVRLFLFYATAHDRREIVSVLASFALVSLQLVAAAPAAP